MSADLIEYLVLIETLWNVNETAGINAGGFTAVLIETLWNVNMRASFVSYHSLSINRNIVECKYTLYRSVGGVHCVLIETLWNVNKDFEQFKKFNEQVLIETLWNVNTRSKTTHMQPILSINRNIVECKFERKIEFLNRNASINRNIVECKSRQKQLRSISGQKY